jgi:Xaa-Pro aminopeptidase
VSPHGTASYEGLTDLPPLVERAVDLARREGFAHSCRPEHGRLLHALAAGAGRIGETGTGCGVGLAWHDHPAVDAAEIRLAPDLAAMVVTRRFPA